MVVQKDITVGDKISHLWEDWSLYEILIVYSVL